MASAGFPALHGQWTQYTSQQLQLFRDGVRVNAMMNGVAVNMSDADMKAVASYIEGLR
jgi:cytochrome c553